MIRDCTLLLFDIVLIDLAVLDYRRRKIKDWYHVAILLLTLLAMVTIPEISLKNRMAGMFVISVPMTVLALLFPGSFGGGDVKLVFASGAFLGWKLVLQGTELAIFLAGIYSFWLIFIKKEKKNVQFALGPYLGAGFILSSFSLF